MARLARLFPGASRNRLVHAFATFWVSAAMHCLLIARLYPAPTISQPRSFIPLFYEPGIYTFFLFQGLGTIIERIFLPIRAKESRLRKTLRLLWCYFVLIGSGRYATNTMVVNGLMAKKEWDMLNWTVVIKMIFGLFKFW
ncbi:hypothetical protein BY996DRAFT_1961715 [Phakopsora pachyrhizi]|nr:hypothetical protein BY996DRAFT_1961715 [Phakopsora pachyrhizi]